MFHVSCLLNITNSLEPITVQGYCWFAVSMVKYWLRQVDDLYRIKQCHDINYHSLIQQYALGPSPDPSQTIDLLSLCHWCITSHYESSWACIDHKYMHEYDRIFPLSWSPLPATRVVLWFSITNRPRLP